MFTNMTVYLFSDPKVRFLYNEKYRRLFIVVPGAYKPVEVPASLLKEIKKDQITYFG